MPAMTAAELAQRLAGELAGDGNRVVSTVAPLAAAGPDALSWVGNAAYLSRLTTTKAGIVLVPTDCDVPPHLTVIRVADPDLALCDALAALAPPLPEVPVGVHPDARVSKAAKIDGAGIGANVYVAAGAEIGPGTQLHPGVYIGPGARVGRDCVLWPNVVVRERTAIGDRVIIHPNATIGADGFGYHVRDGRHIKIPQIGHVVIEDDVEIGANVCIDRARSGETRIGRGTKIDNLVQIGHNVRVGDHCIIVAQTGISGSTTLGTHVVLGGQVGVGDHLHIGDRALCASKAGVASDVPPDRMIRGNPAIDHREFARQAVSVRRLPQLIQKIRALTKRVEQLESAANDTTRR